ncbi:MAG TPA: helix-turn-helix domain-containing protein, partial [Rhizomicrobium sp.]|nr:helix-turn-helix domain-containing protein [Rhizomicrobium sp.]
MQGVSRAAILAAARNLIAQTGIDTFTLSAVARESGLARNDLYGLFRNKTELLLAIAADDLNAAGHCLRTRQTGSVRISLPYEALVTALAPANAPADTIVPEPGPLPGPIAGVSQPPPVIRQPAQAAERPTV